VLVSLQVCAHTPTPFLDWHAAGALQLYALLPKCAALSGAAGWFFVLTDYLLVSAETVALAEGGTSSGSVVRQQPWLSERQQHLVRLIFLLLGKVHICNNSPKLQTAWWQQQVLYMLLLC